MGTEFLKENTAYLTLLDLSASNAAGERDMISAGSIIVLQKALRFFSPHGMQKPVITSGTQNGMLCT